MSRPLLRANGLNETNKIIRIYKRVICIILNKVNTFMFKVKMFRFFSCESAEYIEYFRVKDPKQLLDEVKEIDLMYTEQISPEVR